MFPIRVLLTLSMRQDIGAASCLIHYDKSGMKMTVLQHGTVATVADYH